MITIRDMNPADVSAVLALRLQWLSERFDVTETTQSERDWFARYPDSDEAFGLLAEDGERIIGYLLCALTTHPTMTGVVAEIDEVCVAAEFRRRGIGARLVAAARERLLAAVDNLNAIRIGIDREDEDAKAFWAALGYEQHRVEFVSFLE